MAERRTGRSCKEEGKGNRWAGVALGVIVGGCVGALGARRLHIQDSMWWVLRCPAGPVVFGVWLFPKPQQGLDWHTEIRGK